MLGKPLFLDDGRRTALELLALREGLADRTIEFATQFYVGGDARASATALLNEMNARLGAIRNRGRLLQSLTLFEKVDAGFSVLDWSRLVGEGLVAQDAEIRRGDSAHRLPMNANIQRATHEMLSGATCVADLEAARVMRLSSYRVVSQIMKQSGEPISRRKCERILFSFLNRKSMESLIRFQTSEAIYLYPADFLGDKRELKRRRSRMVAARRPDKLNISLSDDPPYQLQTTADYAIESAANHIFSALSAAIYLADSKSGVVSSDFAVTDSSPKRIPDRIFDQLDYVIQSNFHDEMILLPQPTTLVDALRIRAKPEMQRFREVLNVWCQAASEGDLKLALRMRKDLRLANRSLRAVSMWRRYEKSPWQFAFQLAGGALGPFGAAFTILEALAGAVVRRKESKSSWLVLAQKSVT